jgi:chemotaxis protein histidine kinase CheA
MSDTRRDIELRIRAQDLSTADFKKVSESVDQLALSIEKQVAAASKGQISLSELRESMTRLEQAGKSLTGIAALVDRFKDLTGVVQANSSVVDRNREAIARYRTELESSGQGTKAEQQRLAQLVRSLEQSEAAYRRNAETLEKTRNALEQSGVSTRNLAEAEAQLKTSADQIGPALTKLSEASLSYTRNVREAKEAAQRLAEQQKTNSAALRQAAEEQQRSSESIKQSFGAIGDFVSRNRQNDAAAIASAIKSNTERANAEAKTAAEISTRSRANDAALIGDAIRRNERIAAEQRKSEEKRLSDLAAAQTKERELYRKQQDEVRKIVSGVRSGVTGPSSGGGPAGGAATNPNAATGLFGLRPYEIQNLSYQINDVVTQLASGTRATQVFAQQGGQILQLFSKNLFDLVQYIPRIVAGVGVLVVAFGALGHAFRDLASLREFNGALTASVDGINYQARTLNSIRHEVRSFGTDWETAGKLIRDAISGGIQQDKIKDFVRTAQDIADVTGQKVPEAFKNLVDGFKHGIDGVIALNNQYDFLTVKEFEQIKALYDQGKAAEGAATAFRLLSERQRNAADQAVSPFTRATRDLKTAWDDLLTTLGNSSVIAGLVDLLTRMTTSLGAASRGADGLIKSFNEFRKLKVPSGYFGSSTLFAIVNTLRAATGNTKGIIYDLKRSGQNLPTALGSPSGAARVDTRNLAIDTNELKTLLSVIAEASKTLPEGQRVQLISTERPGALTDAGTQSEHGFGRAIDVRIVDANGSPVDSGVQGIMGPGAPPTAFDQAVLEAAKKLNVGAVAIGSTFTRRPDPGHYSIGGNESIQNALNRGDNDSILVTQKAITHETDKQKIAGDALVSQDRLRLAGLNTTTQAQREELRTLTAEQAYRERLNATGDESLAQQAKKNALLIFDSEQRQKQVQYGEEDRINRERDGKNAATIAAAGQAAAAAALEQSKATGLLLTQDQLRAAQLRGEAEQRAKLQQDEKATAQDRALTNQLAALNRANELKDTFTLENRLKAVSDQYTAIRQAIAKRAEDFPGKPTTVSTADVDAAEAQAKANEEAKFRLEQLNTILQERNTLVSTYNTLVEKGVISSGEAEQKIKAAFESAAPKITEATAAFQDFINTNKNLDPNKIALYTAKIQELNAEAKYTSPLFKAIKDAAAEGFSQGISQSFNTIAEAMGNLIAKTGTWKDVIQSVKVAIGQLFSTLLKSIGEAILKYEALKIASQITGQKGDSGGGGFDFGSIFSGIGSLFGIGGATPGFGGGDFGGGGVIAHQGGFPGRSTPSQRSVHGLSRGWLDNAPRYHSGTIVGLQPDEVASVIQKGEEVLKRDDPRNAMSLMRKSAAGGGHSSVAIRNVLVADPQFVPQGMASAQGEQVVVSIIKQNIPTIRQLLRG